MTLPPRCAPWALAFALALGALGGLCGCNAGAPERASDIQNLHAISDDIASVTMTRSDTSRAHDPNVHSTIPRHYEVQDNR
ncbi:MAG: hypothetical protein ACM3JG_06470 [Thiohalocapsa sp.]